MRSLFTEEFSIYPWKFYKQTFFHKIYFLSMLGITCKHIALGLFPEYGGRTGGGKE